MYSEFCHTPTGILPFACKDKDFSDIRIAEENNHFYRVFSGILYDYKRKSSIL
jgi:hypothetical protein